MRRTAALAPDDDELGFDGLFRVRMTQSAEILDMAGEAPSPIAIMELARIWAVRSRAASADNRPRATEEETCAVVIVGLPRAGTTFLQCLLTLSGGAMSPRGFELLFEDTTDKAIGLAYRRAQLSYSRSRDLRCLHRLMVRGPEECSVGMLTQLGGIIPAAMFGADLLEFVTDGEHDKDAFAGYVAGSLAQVRHRARNAGRCLLLKSPDHVWRRSLLMDTFARPLFVYCERPHVEVIESWMKLVRAVRSTYGMPVHSHEEAKFNRFWSCHRDSWKEDTGTMVVNFQDLISRPTDVALDIAERADLVVDRAALASCAHKLARYL